MIAKWLNSLNENGLLFVHHNVIFPKFLCFLCSHKYDIPNGRLKTEPINAICLVNLRMRKRLFKM